MGEASLTYDSSRRTVLGRVACDEGNGRNVKGEVVWERAIQVGGIFYKQIVGM